MLSGSYIGRNNGVGGGAGGGCYCTWKRKNAGNGHFCLPAQLAADVKPDWKPLPPTRSCCFFSTPLFGFFTPPLAGRVRLSILTHFITEHPERQMEKPIWQQAFLRHRGVPGETFENSYFSNQNTDVVSGGEREAPWGNACCDILGSPKSAVWKALILVRFGAYTPHCEISPSSQKLKLFKATICNFLPPDSRLLSLFPSNPSSVTLTLCRVAMGWSPSKLTLGQVVGYARQMPSWVFHVGPERLTQSVGIWRWECDSTIDHLSPEWLLKLHSVAVT